MGYAETLTGTRARKGEAQGVLSYQNLKGIFANPHINFCLETLQFFDQPFLLGPFAGTAACNL